MKKEYLRNQPTIIVSDYNKQVPFNVSVTTCEHTLITNDVLRPAQITDGHAPIPSYGAIYRLIGDGVHTPSFSGGFLKSKASNDYDPAALNLVVFLYDGVNYWYTISQAA